MNRHAVGVLALTVPLLVACVAAGAPAARTGAPVELTVFAAASLAEALEAAKGAYEEAVPGVTISLATDSSAALATQIEQGARADLLLSADTTAPARIVEAGLADGVPVFFAGNELVIIVPIGNPARIASPRNLAAPGVRIIAAGDRVPITRYAAELMDKLATQPGYPPGFANAYAGNVASREDNVKAVLAKVELGEGDAGIVYATDARASARVETVPLPAGINVRTSYAGVVVRDSRQPAAARAFLEWLAGPAGQGAFARFGFLPPPR